MLRVVGVGVCEGQITERAARIISDAEIVFGSERAIKLAAKHIRCEAVTLGRFGRNVYSAIEKIGRTKNVVVLSTGDPMVAGLGSKLAAEIEPGISSVQMTLARLREDLCGAVVIDAHAKSAEKELDLIRYRNLLILADRSFDPSVFGSRRVAVLENICGEERFVVGKGSEVDVRSDHAIVFVWR